MLIDPAGRLVGVVSFASRHHDDTGVLWLHAREQPARVAALIDHALRQLSAHAQVHAFDFAIPCGEPASAEAEDARAPARSPVRALTRRRHAWLG